MSAVSLDAGPRPRNAALRSGLVLAALLGIGDIVTGALALMNLFFAPPEIGAIMLVLGAATLALIPFAWTGRRRTHAWMIVAARLLSSLTGVPAFFVPEVPAAAIVASAGGVLLAVLVAVLVGLGLGSRR